jgi:hypothetical protein
MDCRLCIGVARTKAVRCLMRSWMTPGHIVLSADKVDRDENKNVTIASLRGKERM